MNPLTARNVVKLIFPLIPLTLAATIAAPLLAPSVAYANPYYVGPGVRIRVAPPPMRVEVRPRAPSPNHVWNAGYWNWTGGQHVWVPGVYVLPPRPGHIWIEHRWVNEGGEWVFQPGHWQEPVVVAQPAPVYVPPPQPVYAEQPNQVVEMAPPPNQVEVRPIAPSPRHVWINGYWAWAGNRHVWMQGRWEEGRRDMVWEPHRWERNAYGGGWHMTPGHWRHL